MTGSLRPNRRKARSLVASLKALALVLCVGMVLVGCRVSTVEICDAGDICALSCAVDSDCPDGECVAGLCQDALNIDPNDGSAAIITTVPGVVIEMGSPEVGEESVRTVSLVNEGRGPFILQAVTRTGGTGVEFEATPLGSLPALVGAGEAFDIVFRWTRVQGPVAPGVFLIRTNAGACSFGCEDPTAFEIDLTTPLGASDAAIAMSPNAYDFGVDAAGTAADTTSFLLRNLSATTAATIESVTATGAVASYEIDAPATPFGIEPGQSAEVIVRFVATTNGTHALTLTATAGQSSASASITGQVGQQAAALAFTPPSLAFDVTVVGASESKSATLRNTGVVAATVTGLVVEGAQAGAFLATAPSFPLDLAPNATTTIDVTFTAQAIENAAANVRVSAEGLPDTLLSLAALADDEVAGPNLDVIVGPKSTFTSDCGCQATPGVSAANIDVEYRSAAQTCAKPANPACGVGGECACPQMNAFGTVTWGSAHTENVRGAEWIIDEQIRHRGTGDDGIFTVRVSLADDCLAVPGSLSPAVNHACCELDCNSEFNPNAPQACFDYGQFPSCASLCDAEVANLSVTDCFERGPVAIRTVLRFSGGNAVVDRHFCSTLASQGAAMDVVDVVRTGGLFQLAAIKPGVTEVDAAVACE